MNDVESRLRACEIGWEITATSRLTGGFASDVFECTSTTRGDVVVKLVPNSADFIAEATALQAWHETRAAVRVLDTNSAECALLLERVRPGTHLSRNGLEEVVESAATILSALHGVIQLPTNLPSLESAYQRFEQIARDDVVYERRTRSEPHRGEAGLIRLEAAADSVRSLCASAQQPVLLHGDFLTKNILRSGTAYVAIDPIAMIGDPCADVGQLAADQAPGRILEVAHAIARTIGYDPYRSQQWAAIWTVLQGCQAWRDDQDQLDVLLRTGEIADLLAPSR